MLEDENQERVGVYTCQWYSYGGVLREAGVEGLRMEVRERMWLLEV